MLALEPLARVQEQELPSLMQERLTALEPEERGLVRRRVPEPVPVRLRALVPERVQGLAEELGPVRRVRALVASRLQVPVALLLAESPRALARSHLPELRASLRSRPERQVYRPAPIADCRSRAW